MASRTHFTNLHTTHLYPSEYCTSFCLAYRMEHTDTQLIRFLFVRNVCMENRALDDLFWKLNGALFIFYFFVVCYFFPIFHEICGQRKLEWMDFFVDLLQLCNRFTDPLIAGYTICYGRIFNYSNNDIHTYKLAFSIQHDTDTQVRIKRFQ